MKEIKLIVGDLHAPYMHQDAVAFLAAVKKKYNPQEVVFMGDETDGHSISFHEHNPDLPSAGEELKNAIAQLSPLYKLFPRATILESNHGSLVYRKALTAGLPEAVLRGYREILHAPKGWVWKFDYTMNTIMGPVYLHHGKTGSINKLSQSMAMSAIQGHFHSKFYISYWASPVGLFWDANVGCLVDYKSRAADYGKNFVNKPILGCMVIENGIPHLIPMCLNKQGRWTGKL